MKKMKILKMLIRENYQKRQKKTRLLILRKTTRKNFKVYHKESRSEPDFYESFYIIFSFFFYEGKDSSQFQIQTRFFLINPTHE